MSAETSTQSHNVDDKRKSYQVPEANAPASSKSREQERKLEEERKRLAEEYRCTERQIQAERRDIRRARELNQQREQAEPNRFKEFIYEKIAAPVVDKISSAIPHKIEDKGNLRKGTLVRPVFRTDNNVIFMVDLRFERLFYRQLPGEHPWFSCEQGNMSEAYGYKKLKILGTPSYLDYEKYDLYEVVDHMGQRRGFVLVPEGADPYSEARAEDSMYFKCRKRFL